MLYKRIVSNGKKISSLFRQLCFSSSFCFGNGSISRYLTVFKVKNGRKRKSPNREIILLPLLSSKNKLALITCLGSLIIFGLSACEEQHTGKTIEVKYAGALRNMMHKGDISAQISLSELADLENLYALGAISKLKGEIQIFDGQAWNTRVVGDSLIVDSSFAQSATLLVYAQVAQWNTIDIPNTIHTRKDLEQFIKQQAAEQGINTNAPFPFLLEGAFQSVDWHVINWKDGDMEHSHEKHIKSGLHGTLKDVSLQALGFYSERHKGIFTHHTAHTHIHMKTANKRIAGHIDELVVGEQVLLKLPVITDLKESILPK